MPIAVSCPACGRGHQAPERAAGRVLKCLACAAPMPVPAPEVEPELDAAAILLADDGPPASPAPVARAEETVEPAAPPVRRPPAPPAPPRRVEVAPAALKPLTTDDPPAWRRHLHWLLALAMIPLAASLLTAGDEPDLLERVAETLQGATPADQARFLGRAESARSLDELLGLLPGERLRGAWLPRSTAVHWALAAAAAAGYLVFLMFLASDGSARPGQVLAVGLATATVGVGLLLLVQAIASGTEGRIMVGRGLAMLVFWLLKFIAFSYGAASDPENGFLLSFVGFTLGVGLCEELVKAAPLFWHRSEERGKAWRGLFVWGLASGAGFGVAEGILYSSRYYNGVSGPGTYAVRFVSCVALHAVWSGSVGVTLYLRRDSFDGAESWHGWVGPILTVLAVPMVLHGLFDTCLKRDLPAAALGVAFVSFGWLAFLTSRLYGADDADATRAMLAEYKRRRAG